MTIVSRAVVAAPLAAVCLAACALLAACASSGGNGGENGGGGRATPGPDAERRFYEGRCGVCHVPFQRSDFPAAKWPSIVEKFAPRAGLTRAQRERILLYLTADAAAPPAR